MRVLRPAQASVAAAGLALALSGAIVESPRGANASGAVIACVNGAPIRESALAHALARREAALAGPADAETRAALVDLLVDEELLVQRAAEMGLVDSDRAVRKALARAAIDAAVREAAARVPDESELREFHAANPELFTFPRRLRVRTMAFDASRDPEAAARRAREAGAAIADGLAFASAAERFGDRPGPPLPDALLPEAALRRWLGPSLSEAALSLAPNEVSAPLQVGETLYLLQLAEVEAPQARTFESARAQVAAEFDRRRGDAALAARLARLRAQARIVRGEMAP